MKNILFLCLSFFIGACMIPDIYTFQKNFVVGTEKEVTVGSSMIFVETKHSDGKSNFPFSGFRQELSYLGIDHNVISIGYTEYGYHEGDLLARGNFFQSLKYDLTSSDTITFRNIDLKVIEATAKKIHFIVLSNPFLDFDTVATKSPWVQ